MSLCAASSSARKPSARWPRSGARRRAAMASRSPSSDGSSTKNSPDDVKAMVKDLEELCDVTINKVVG